MKRILFLFLGAVLFIIGGLWSLILIGDMATSPKIYLGTAHIQFSDQSKFPKVIPLIPDTQISELIRSDSFKKLVNGTANNMVEFSEFESLKWIEKCVRIHAEPKTRQIVVSVRGLNSENVTALAHVLARTWKEYHAPTEKILPAQPAITGRFSLIQALVFEPLMWSLLVLVLGCLALFFGWHLPRLTGEPAAPVITLPAKY